MAMQSVIPAPPSGAVRARITGRMTPALFAETCGLAQIGPDRVEEKIPQQAIGAGSRDGG